MTGRGRKLAPEEAALWQRVIATVTPLVRAKAAPVGKPAVAAQVEEQAAPVPPPAKPAAPRLPKHPVQRIPPAPVRKEASENTLDGSWDRRLSRGLVSPESSIDLHGHNLASAYDRLDFGLAQAVARGDRVLLLITGKPPRPESERPHARGAIRAAVGDWLASSRHADRIAAVRAAHPRHGGTGALYIVLRRPKPAAQRNS
ncbi:Smr/MutS family protein [Sphingomonas sp. JC676]|uniref:Smr/MutS family protein n=1 Tax=Sphingomonas sp. JC676 TaxID=2768065 RepID=UPI00165766BC|nr:Smr/MutS family protein [Sphingomonas sp. JC676]MBC9030982.1 Smr/MutS family protein [Sphingomonas sp. JC676]